MSYARIVVAGVAMAMALVGLAPVVASQAAACPAPGGATLPPLDQQGSGIVIAGRGYGHGVGMSQWGAQGAALAGCSATQILAAYYQGAAGADVGDKTIRLSLGLDQVKVPVTSGATPLTWQVCEATTCTDVAPEATMAANEAWIARVMTSGPPGFLLQRHDGADWQEVARVTQPEMATTAVLRLALDTAGPATVVVGGRSLVLGRGTLELDVRDLGDGEGGRSAFATLVVPMEDYLRGIAEVPASWQPAALHAQAIAARSYAHSRVAARSQTPLGLATCRCHLYSTISDQHFVGWTGESGAKAPWGRAVADTHGQVLVDGAGKVISAFYSSSSGGHTRSVEDWGGSPASHLTGIDDSAWELRSGNPNTTWKRVFDPAAMGGALGIGTVTGIVTPQPRSPDGRVGDPDLGHGGITVTGTGGTWRGSGTEFRRALGLRSAFFTVLARASGTWSAPSPPPSVPASALAVTGDWDGDGTDTPGWFSAGRWWLTDLDGTFRQLAYGKAGDKPVTGDWDGDGVDTIGVVRGNLWILRSDYHRGADDVVMAYGRASDTPVTGDWDNDGVDTLGVVRGNLWILRSDYYRGADDVVMAYGRASDTPVTGDWDNDGVDTLGVVRGNLWILRSEYVRGADDVVMAYGSATDRKVVGDWDDDGTDTLGVVRDRLWILRNEYHRGADDMVFTY